MTTMLNYALTREPVRGHGPAVSDMVAEFFTGASRGKRNGQPFQSYCTVEDARNFPEVKPPSWKLDEQRGLWFYQGES
jgi:hypothetical protein